MKTIEAIGVTSQYLSLADTIADEAQKYQGIPADVAELVDVDKDDDHQKDMNELVEHITKEN